MVKAGTVQNYFDAPATSRRPVSSGPVRGWSWPHMLALIGVPILAWNAWTIVAWLADGPAPVHDFRDQNSLTWNVARVIEAIVVLGSALVIVYLVRSCRRAGRILTFEVMFCLACATMTWSDFGMNFFQPIFVASSNFINVNNSCGHMPFVVNPDCGRAPDPILFWFLTQAFLIPACAIGVSKLVGRARNRWPGISTAKLFGLVLAMGLAIALGEIPVVAMGVWTYAGPQWMSVPLGHGTQYPVVAWVQTGLFFAFCAALYTFRNDKGQTLAERGLERTTPRRRTAITIMALYGAVQIIAWVPGAMPMTALSFFQDGWPKLPAHLVNDVCDAPGVEGTRYGVCPGGPGYRMPGRNSLPGRSP